MLRVKGADSTLNLEYWLLHPIGSALGGDNAWGRGTLYTQCRVSPCSLNWECSRAGETSKVSCLGFRGTWFTHSHFQHPPSFSATHSHLLPLTLILLPFLIQSGVLLSSLNWECSRADTAWGLCLGIGSPLTSKSSLHSPTSTTLQYQPSPSLSLTPTHIHHPPSLYSM